MERRTQDDLKYFDNTEVIRLYKISRSVVAIGSFYAAHGKDDPMLLEVKAGNGNYGGEEIVE